MQTQTPAQRQHAGASLDQIYRTPFNGYHVVSKDGTVAGNEFAPGRRRGRARIVKAYVVTADFAGIAVGMTAAFGISSLQPLGIGAPRTTSAVIAAVSLPVWLVVFRQYRLYESRRVSSRVAEINRLSHASAMSTLLMAAVSFLGKQSASRAWVVLCFPTVLFATWMEREVVRWRFRRLRLAGRSIRPVILVGANVEAELLLRMLEDSPDLGYRVVSVVDEVGKGQLLGHPVVGRLEDTLRFVKLTGATGVVVATTAVTSASCNRLVRDLTDAGIHVELSLSLQGIAPERLVARPLDTTPVVYIEPVRRGGWRGLAKRVFDMTAALALLIILFPLLVLVAIAIKLDSRGPLVFSQLRVGRDERAFRVFKFRTMVPNADELLEDLRDANECDGPLFKIRKDPRVTRVGQTLRRYSLDELPQLLNVVRGDMSLVGPRPALYAEMQSWSPELRSRSLVRPGLTGLWQVRGRSSLGFTDYERLDLYYVDNWSLWRDLEILAKTLLVVLAKHGAY